MSATHIDIRGEDFLINGKPTYAGGGSPDAEGLLMNARFIQGIFDDRAEPERFARFGRVSYDPEQNTDDLIDALPEWYEYGLRAFTVGLQGGGPVYTVDDLSSIDNNPFGADGTSFDPDYEGRLDRLIRAADEQGMIVIVSFLYQGQAPRLADGRAVRSAVQTACSLLKNGGYTNVIIEVANEHNVGHFSQHPLVHSEEGAAFLIDLARKSAPGIPVGCSRGGGQSSRELAEASDVILVHGNGCDRQDFYGMIKKIRSWDLEKPIVCNEDSPRVSQLGVAFRHHVSWGYYNNLTKQEPPAHWRVTPGEDRFFARRMAEGVGIERPEISRKEEYYLQGFEPEMTVDKKRWIRLASLHPETIDHVEFYRDGTLVDTAYEDPFMVNYKSTWKQDACTVESGETWRAVICLRDGQVLERSATA